MSYDDVLFQFGPPPRGAHVPKWMWDGPITANVSVSVVRDVFEPTAATDPAQLIGRYRAALILAARKRAETLDHRPEEPIHLGRGDLERLLPAVNDIPWT